MPFPYPNELRHLGYIKKIHFFVQKFQFSFVNPTFIRTKNRNVFKWVNVVCTLQLVSLVRNCIEKKMMSWQLIQDRKKSEFDSEIKKATTAAAAAPALSCEEWRWARQAVKCGKTYQQNIL